MGILLLEDDLPNFATSPRCFAAGVSPPSEAIRPLQEYGQGLARPSRSAVASCRTGEARGRGKFVCLLGGGGAFLISKSVGNFRRSLLIVCSASARSAGRWKRTGQAQNRSTALGWALVQTSHAQGRRHFLGIGATRWQTARQRPQRGHRRVFLEAPKPRADRPQAR